MGREALKTRKELNMAQNDEVTKVDVTGGGSAEAKPEPKKTVAELEAEIARLTALTENQKNSISRANTDAADWKRKYTATLDEAKQKELKLEEERQKEREELEALRKDKRISTYKSKLMEAGIDHATADLMANSLPDGVNEEYFNTLKAFNESQRQAIETATLNKQPGLSVGMPPTGAAKTEEDMKLDKIFGLAH